MSSVAVKSGVVIGALRRVFKATSRVWAADVRTSTTSALCGDPEARDRGQMQMELGLQTAEEAHESV